MEKNTCTAAEFRRTVRGPREIYRSAPEQSNPKAQTLLGAMYATGHCVNRDLPTAYRWFAKALHGDPGNSRVQRDLEVLVETDDAGRETAGYEEPIVPLALSSVLLGWI